MKNLPHGLDNHPVVVADNRPAFDDQHRDCLPKRYLWLLYFLSFKARQIRSEVTGSSLRRTPVAS